MAVQFRQMTAGEYLAFDEASEIQYEFIDGELIAMTGRKRTSQSDRS